MTKKKKSKRRFKIPMLHRWFFTHSVLYPMFLLGLVKYYIKDGFYLQEFGLILFIPTLVHLLADFQVHLLLNDDNMDTTGSWRISMFPFKNLFSKRNSYRLSPIGSIIWMVLNIITVLIYIIIVYDLFGWLK